ncbi:MAG: hypothetical protein HUK24_04015, partial [Sphaerochaetaceae bacterium]|nr:hypothetical protein [Sphaerochaetaceae bacterium]
HVEAEQILRSHDVEVYKGPISQDVFKWADLVVKSPSVNLQSSYLKGVSSVETQMTYFLSSPEIENVKIIGVMGVNGKSHGASSIFAGLRALGKTVHLIGNSGVSAFAELERWSKGEKPEYVVCELSYSQIREIYGALSHRLPQIEAFVITDYRKIKSNLDYNIQQLKVIASASKVIIGPQEMKEMITKIEGKSFKNFYGIESNIHNLSKAVSPNMAIAYATLRKIGNSIGNVNRALKAFKGNPNKLEMVGSYGKVMFVNDSSTTIPDAVPFTINKLGNVKKHLMIGGTNVKLDPTPLVEAAISCSSVHLLDGSFTKEVLIPALDKANISYTGPYASMDLVVSSAFGKCNINNKTPEAVLLCPGAAALNYPGREYGRGEVFTTAVEKFLKLIQESE